jgi:ribosome assembly protein YihI (activator of Der GTPase)
MRLDWVLSKAQSACDLTPWEQKFVDDLTDRRERLKDRITISEKQEEILERIASERTA